MLPQYSPGLIAGIVVAGTVGISLLLGALLFCIRRDRRRRQERAVRFGMDSNVSLDDSWLIAFPYGDPNRRPTGNHKPPEMGVPLGWNSEVPQRRAVHYELPQSSQELPVMSSPPARQRESVDDGDSAPPLQPPPRSPHRDIDAYYLSTVGDPSSSGIPSRPHTDSPSLIDERAHQPTDLRRPGSHRHRTTLRVSGGSTATSVSRMSENPSSRVSSPAWPVISDGSMRERWGEGPSRVSPESTMQDARYYRSHRRRE